MNSSYFTNYKITELTYNFRTYRQLLLWLSPVNNSFHHTWNRSPLRSLTLPSKCNWWISFWHRKWFPWLNSWEIRPESSEKPKEKIIVLVSKVPKMIQIIGHRLLLGEPCKSGNPILSIMQSDLIIYGELFWIF